MTSPLQFCFLDTRPKYDAHLLASEAMGGVQKGTILLAEALVRRGHQVHIYNDRDSSDVINGVSYHPVEGAKVPDAAIVVSNNSIKIFDRVPEHTKVLWSRNNINLSRVRKEKSIGRIFKSKPHIVFPGTCTAKKCPWYFPFKTRNVILHGVDPTFEPAHRNEAPAPVAVFASQPNRNLWRVIEAWEKTIHPQLPDAKLMICYPKEKLYPEELEGKEAQGIEILGSLPKDELHALYARARVLIYPGHRTETFCNVAAEASNTGLPICTMGMGSLKERVQHGTNGLVSRSIASLGRDALRILKDDELWMTLHRNAIAASAGTSWDARAEEWEKAAASWI